MVTMTAKQFIDEFTKAIKFERYQVNNSNSKKNIDKYEIVNGLLATVPQNLTLSVSGVAFNDKQTVCTIGNVGDLAECVIRWHLAKRKPNEIVKRASGKCDITFNGKKYEIKTAMSCRWLASPSPNTRTILVNKCGAWIVDSSEVKLSTDKYNRLPYNEEIGEPFDELTDSLGLWA